MVGTDGSVIRAVFVALCGLGMRLCDFSGLAGWGWDLGGSEGIGLG